MSNFKDKIKSRIKRNFSNRSSYGNANSKRYYNKPENVEMYKPKEGIAKIRILNYGIGSENHPNYILGDRNFRPGEPDYLLEIWVHRQIGLLKNDYICLKNTFGKPCPICEALHDLYSDENASADDISSLKPSRRVLYNIYDEKDDKLKLFEASHFLFEKELLEEACIGEEITDFTDVKIIKFRVTTEKIGNNEFPKFKSFKFEDSEEKLDKEITDKVIPLDTIINIPTYEEVKNAFLDNGSDIKTEDNNNEKKDNDYYKDVVEKEGKQQQKSSISNKCPHGHIFGEDCEEYNECDTCDLWEECSEA